MRSYRRAVELEPTAVTTLTSLGILLVEAGTDPAAAAEAETLFRSVLELEPDHTVALCKLGKAGLLPHPHAPCPPPRSLAPKRRLPGPFPSTIVSRTDPAWRSSNLL